MAKAQSPTLLRGKIGNLIFRVRDGKQVVHLAPSPYDEEKYYKRRLKQLSFRLNGQEFGGAHKIACRAYGDLLGGIHELNRPYAHNLLAARLKKAGDFHVKNTLPENVYYYAREFSLYDVWKAWQGLDLSHKGAPAAQVSMTPVGPGHNPTAIRITGLRDAARAVPIGGNARLEVRIHIRQADFNEQAWSEKHNRWESREPGHPTGTGDLSYAKNPTQWRSNGLLRPSGWIPVDALPQDALTLKLPQNPKAGSYDRFITAIVIEWREIRAVGDKEIEHPRQAIVRIAAIHGDAEDFIQRPYTYIPPADRNEAAPDPVFTPVTDWHQNPSQYIEEALDFMATQPPSSPKPG